MGIEKIGTAIGKEIIAWTRTGGSKSLLTSKPVKVNINELRLAAPLHSDIVQMSKQIGKHKIPRYIYHMTSSENYRKILESGVLKPNDRRLPTGVYTLELDSFGKYWNRCFRNDLCDQVFRSGDEKDIVMLKIPTKNLDTSRLRIRTQKEVEGKLGDESEEFFNYCRMPKEREAMIKELIQKFGIKDAMRRYIDMLPEKFAPITKGYDVKMSSLLKQRKLDLEYIYLGEIPVSEINVVGKVEYKDLFNVEYFFDSVDRRNTNMAKKIFEKLFSGQPEEKSMLAWRE